jgi:hypothetical protein
MPHRPFRDEVRDAVTPRATLLIVGVIALQLLFIASYVGALHDPKPKDVPFAVVAPGPAAAQAVTRLNHLPPNTDALPGSTAALAGAAITVAASATRRNANGEPHPPTGVNSARR